MSAHAQPDAPLADTALRTAPAARRAQPGADTAHPPGNRPTAATRLGHPPQRSRTAVAIAASATLWLAVGAAAQPLSPSQPIKPSQPTPSQPLPASQLLPPSQPLPTSQPTTPSQPLPASQLPASQPLPASPPLLPSRPLPPPPGAPRPLSIAAPAERMLANGLRVVVAERRVVPLVTAQLVVLAGSETDPPGRAGRAALTAELLTQGTRRLGAPRLAAAAEALGGALESMADWHDSSVAITVATPLLDRALALIGEVIAEPAFDAGELERLRNQMQDELKLDYASPGTLAELTALRSLFGGGAYGHPAEGTPASLGRIARGEVLAMHAAHYRPDNAVLVFAGDVDLAAAVQLAEKHFGRWRARKAAPPAAVRSVEGPPVAPGVVALDLGDSPQAVVAIAMKLPPRTPETERDAATAAVVNAVLGAGYSSRLNQEIRIRRGLSYGASSEIDLRPLAGVLLATAQVRNEHAAQVVEAMQREIDRLVETPLPADELAARKAALVGRFARSVETTEGLAAQVVSRVVAGLPAAGLAERARLIGDVSAADVQRYAREHFGRAGRRVVVGGDAREFGAALAAAEPRLLRIAADELDLDRPDAIKRR